MEQGWISVVITLLGGTGVGGTIVGFLNARNSAKAGQSSNEVEAAKVVGQNWSSLVEGVQKQITILQGQIDRQNEQIIALTDQVKRLKAKREDDSSYINSLVDHINKGLGPPPPERKVRE